MSWWFTSSTPKSRSPEIDTSDRLTRDLAKGHRESVSRSCPDQLCRRARVGSVKRGAAASANESESKREKTRGSRDEQPLFSLDRPTPCSLPPVVAQVAATMISRSEGKLSRRTSSRVIVNHDPSRSGIKEEEEDRFHIAVPDREMDRSVNRCFYRRTRRRCGTPRVGEKIRGEIILAFFFFSASLKRGD